MRSHLLIVDLSACIICILLRNLFPVPMCARLFLFSLLSGSVNMVYVKVFVPHRLAFCAEWYVKIAFLYIPTSSYISTICWRCFFFPLCIYDFFIKRQILQIWQKYTIRVGLHFGLQINWFINRFLCQCSLWFLVLQFCSTSWDPGWWLHQKFFLLLSIVLTILRPSVFLYEVEDCSSKVCKQLCWNFERTALNL